MTNHSYIYSRLFDHIDIVTTHKFICNLNTFPHLELRDMYTQKRVTYELELATEGSSKTISPHIFIVAFS